MALDHEGLGITELDIDIALVHTGKARRPGSSRLIVRGHRKPGQIYGGSKCKIEEF
jgi:hypothetical protein